MNRIYALVGVLALVFLPIQCARAVVDDLEHPDRGRADWTHDPGRYGPLVAVLVLVPTALLILELVRPRLGVRLHRLLARAGELQRAGRYAEAERVLDRFRCLWVRHGLNRQRPLS